MWCYWRTSATLGSFLLSTEVARPLSSAIFCFLISWRTTSPSFISCSFLFFFKLGMGSRLITGGGREEGGWDFGASLEDDPLFLSAMRFFKPFLGLSDISSSSSLELSSIFANMRPGVQTLEVLSSSPLVSEISTRSTYTSPSSSSWNWSISSSSERREKAISSLGHDVLLGKEPRYRDAYPTEPRVACPNCVAHFLEVV